MDDFVSSVQSQVYGLSTRDAFPSYINLQYVFFYRNTNNTKDFMDANTLQRAFYKTLEQFPILVGHYRQRSDRGLSIARKFHRDAWPKDLMTAHVMALPVKGTKQLRLSHVNIVRLKDNSGVALYLAMSRSEPIPTATFTIGASKLHQGLLREYFSKENFASKLLAWLAPHTRARLLSFATRQVKITGGLLHRRARTYRNNDVITAIIAKVNAQVVSRITKKSSNIGDAVLSKLRKGQEVRLVTVACDIRHRLGLSAADLIGNGQFLPTLQIPNAQAESPITPETLCEIAVMVRQAVDAATPERIAEFIEEGDRHPGGFTCPIANSSSLGSSIGVSNQTRFGVYETDFGYGIPEFALIDPELGPGLVSILPACPPSTDYYINISNLTTIIDGLNRNEFWTGISERIF
ncbi:hypothetical protein DL89DRAFT_290735 [Linderina pennispora]|uniref:Uncharacterized protein n=1 Tax=Linderina pennispora TaxID=61395 RepID=A0A1Y1WH94_9FUNG|nr:uncharacterized protein DL89DRAFT_290735 [Linderina pennispora]ORX72941.1 hypothetical protein DL89DRAFT_290735 [Linderina pennispora]